MERSPIGPNTTAFETKDRTYYVTKTKNGRNTVRIEAKAGWHITRVGLGNKRTAWLILRGLRGMSKRVLERPTIAGHIHVLLYDFQAKGTGAEWIAMRMLRGNRPILLKAPALFKHKVIHIEATTTEGVYHMRVVDPYTDSVSAPIEVGQASVDRAIKVFGNENKKESKQLLG